MGGNLLWVGQKGRGGGKGGLTQRVVAAGGRRFTTAGRSGRWCRSGGGSQLVSGCGREGGEGMTTTSHCKRGELKVEG